MSRTDPVPSAVSAPLRGVLRGRADEIAVLAVAAVMLAAAAWRIRLSLGEILELDELYTRTLIADDRLLHMWKTAFLGVDGNPPLYLTLAWALVRAFPFGMEPVLRLFNLGLMAGTAVALNGILRRVADGASTAVGLAGFCYLSIGPVYALPELRTYALYLLLATLTLRATLAVVDRPTGWRAAVLALVGSITALAHSFGGVYVATDIGAALLVAAAGCDRRRFLVLCAAAIPPGAVTVAWVVTATPHQLATATPYGWILSPDMPLLLLTLTGSVQVSILALAALPVAAVLLARHRRVVRHRLAADPARATLCAIVAGFAALTVAAWIASQVVTPFFSYRYFLPNLIGGAVLVVAATARLRRGTRPALQLAYAAACVVAGASAVVAGGLHNRDLTPCLDADGRFLEGGIADAALPLVAESPHSWMPRQAYAPARTTLFPLDWDVVVGYPYRPRNNAMDYHIMETLRDRAPPGSAFRSDILPTADLLARYDTFLVLNEARASWFDHLRKTVPLEAELLKEGPACRIWRVRLTHVPGERA